MIRLFTGYTLWLKALVLLGFLAQFALSSAYADGSPNMLSIPTQTIVAEQLFNYRILVDSPGNQPVGMRLINAPKGATLSDNGDGSHELRWIPPANVGEQTVIIVQAYSLAEPNLISTQRVVLQRGNAEQIQAATAAASVAVATNKSIGPGVATHLATRLATRSSNTSTSGNTVAEKTATPKTAATLATTANLKTPETPAAPIARAALTTTNTPSTVKTELSNTNTASDTSNNVITVQPVGVEAAANQSTALANSTETVAVAEAESVAATDSVAASSNAPASSVSPALTVESIASSRPELPELGLQSLTVGEDFEFFIRPIAPNHAQVRLSAESLPVGASFEDVFEGSKMLRWTPTADQVGEHKMVLVLVAEDETDLSLRTEREVIFDVEPKPPVELAPILLFEPMSAQIVSAGRKVNIRVDPIVSDEKIALLHVDRLPSGGSFDENKDGTRTFHWPTTQADQGEHVFRFTAIHPDNADLVANVDVLIVVGSPDGSGSTGPNMVATNVDPSSPEPDAYPSADSPSPSPEPDPDGYLSADSQSQEPYPSPESPSPAMASSVDSPSPEPYPSADTASPEPLAVKPPPPPRPTAN